MAKTKDVQKKGKMVTIGDDLYAALLSASETDFGKVPVSGVAQKALTLGLAEMGVKVGKGKPTAKKKTAVVDDTESDSE